MIPCSSSSGTQKVIRWAKGKTVLDLGCIGNTQSINRNKIGNLHRGLAKVAKRVVGVDIKMDGIRLLQQEGYDVRFANLDKAPFDLGEKFEVVVARATMEHLCNLKIFMDNVRRHLATGGIFVGTVHNPQAFERFVECIVWKKATHIIYHTHWQSEKTLEYLFAQSSLELQSIEYFQQFGRSWKGKIFDILFFWLPSWFSRTILFVAKAK